MQTRQRWTMALTMLALAACSKNASPPHQQTSLSSAGADPVQAPSTVTPADANRPNAVMNAVLFDDPQVRAAYVAAKKYAHVLEQIYCYCHCKENIGHRALVQCFETEHASGCDVCMTEAMTAAKMTEEGKTPKEIQQAIDAYYRT
ncbi:MAG: CYCXC family (seleno)protein [Gemmatimonadaceae bacterium]